MEQSEAHNQDEYVDNPHIRLENLALDPPAGVDFTREHVQWAMSTQLPDHIAGVDHSQGGESHA